MKQKSSLKTIVTMTVLCGLVFLSVNILVKTSYWRYPLPYPEPSASGERVVTACGWTRNNDYVYEYQVLRPIDEVKKYYKEQINEICNLDNNVIIFHPCVYKENCFRASCRLYSISTPYYSAGRDFFVQLESLGSGETAIYHATQIWQSSKSWDYACP